VGSASDRARRSWPQCPGKLRTSCPPLPLQFVQFASAASGQYLKHDDFFSNDLVKTYYKNHMSFLLNHVNHLNGIKLKDDPTILAWNLLNEPRCECRPTGISNGQVTSEVQAPDSDCADIYSCTGNLKVRRGLTALTFTRAPARIGNLKVGCGPT
jgi:hypothetical protein